jgi:translation initiation factor 4A
MNENKKIKEEIKEEIEEEIEDVGKIEEFDSFDEMKLKESLLRGIYSYGFEYPSKIQSKAIVPLSQGFDIIAQSQSGTGKTGAFSIGMLQNIDVQKDKTQALLLAPTRELADQIYKVVKCLSINFSDLEIELSMGGIRSKSFSRWEKKKTSHIVIGTPGRVLDNLKRKRLNISDLKVMILDEADEMLSKGFIEQVKDIFNYIPPECQVALFSATMPEEVLLLTKNFMKTPLSILVKQDELTLDGITQFYIALENKSHKLETLFDLFSMISITQAIIYTNTKKMTEDLYYYLSEEGFSASMISGNMLQEERNEVMKKFREGKTRVLISTDMLARGIDIQQVSLVLNYDFPKEREIYIHRIGRSGRFGRKGVAINLITQEDSISMKEIETFYNTKIQEMPVDISSFL